MKAVREEQEIWLGGGDGGVSLRALVTNMGLPRGEREGEEGRRGLLICVVHALKNLEF